MRPSASNRCIDSRATSRRTGSKPEIKNRPRRIIDQHRYTSGRFESANVPAFTSYNAPFDFIALERNRGRRVFEGVFTGVTLYGDSDNRARFVFSAFFGFISDPVRKDCRLGLGVAFNVFEEFCPGFGLAQSGRLLQLLANRCVQFRQFAFLLVETRGPLASGCSLRIETLLGLENPLQLGVD